jgi:hypothetical protein
MPRRELLTDHQRATFTEPATDERTMVRNARTPLSADAWYVR